MGDRPHDALIFMRPVRLARIAAEAETVRWQAFAARAFTRVACACISLLFVIGAVTFAHIAAWYWLRIDRELNFYETALVLGGFDLAVAVVLILIAGRSTPSRTEREALEVRKRAVAEMVHMLTLAQLLMPLLRLANLLRRRNRRAP
jgi:hypothetical protein